ncbi:Guanine deaminase [Crenothrix polyspora]|uniref:Guanine deaminase n=1 Tax=Crenothrix polyspora TaxID=360316 RepID=A0A1R4HIF0_9GAMM|nr:nucleoside deaminase [Crenothrix polyspora]SJM95781.1 Guanine deaminase [Crenothrix polyspora]
MHTQFLQQAIALAVDNVKTGAGGPYGAVIVKDNQLIAASGNKVTQNTDPTAHAEIMAIRLACTKLDSFQLRDCVLYTSCEPCPMCLGAIYWARLSKVYFACSHHDAAEAKFDDSFIYEQIAISPAERSIPMLHVKVLNDKQPFEAWMSKIDKILY